MENPKESQKIVVGVDGSPASIEGLRQAQLLAVPLGAEIDALACWVLPNMYDSTVAVGIEGFKEHAEEVLRQALITVFGPERPPYVHAHIVEGPTRSVLIEASKNASLLIVGRRGHGGFTGMLLGSVSSACIAHAHCPVLVVHQQETQAAQP